MLPQLRPYQIEILNAVLRSVQARAGLTFSVEVSRQGGKNEMSAQLELLLLVLHMLKGGDAIKASPTFRPQALISLARLRDRLEQSGFQGVWKQDHGYAIRLGRARQVFLSADSTASVVGHTAGILLEIDEAQDVPSDRYSKDFRPMASSTNSTTVLYGTPWDDLSLLEQIKQVNLEAEVRDGVRRHFRFDWEHIAKYVPEYGEYVRSERERLGEDHPLFRTQYRLLPLGRAGRLFTPAQLVQLRGDHQRQRFPAGGIHVAGLDLAGADEDSDEPLAVVRPRDSTVLTLARVTWGSDPIGRIAPSIQVLDHFADVGTRHSALFQTLLDIIRNVWKCKAVVVDATGIGAGVASFLKSALRSVVEPFTFTASSKSELAFGLLAAVNAGRLKMYAGADENAGEFWKQMELARSAIRPNLAMNFYVDPREGHDDYLMSLALAVHGAQGATPRQATGRQPGN